MGKRYKFKVALIGDYGVGKSSIFRRLKDNVFVEKSDDDNEYDFHELKVEVKDNEVKVMLWDTAGMEENNSMEGSFFRGLVGLFLVYDITTYKSFERIEHWKEQVEAFSDDGVKLMLIGNKCDSSKKQRIVEEFDGKTLAAKLHVPFFETSAKEGTNCQEAFHELLESVIDSGMVKGTQLPTVQVTPENTEKGGGCKC